MSAMAQSKQETRERLKAVAEMITRTRGNLAESKKRVERARAAFDKASHPDGRPVTEWPEFKAAEDAVRERGTIQDQLNALTSEWETLAGLLDEGLGARAGIGPDEFGGGLGASFLADTSVMETLAGWATSKAGIGRVRLGEGVDRHSLVGMIGRYSASAGEATIGNAARGTTYVGFRETPRRQLRLLDLFPSLPLDTRSIEFSVEVPAGTAHPGIDSAAETAEGTTKPEHTVDYLDVEAVARTVAHHTKLRKQSLADQALLASVVRNRLTYGVLRRLENQLVGGDGVGENLLGILNTTGVGSVEFDADELAADQVLEGIVSVLLAEATPNFIALNPRDWASMLKAKADDGDGQYFSGGPFVAAAERLWNVATVPSTGIPQGKALVGDAAIGATVFVREGVNVLVSDSDQDDFVKNKITMLGEGRFALAVWEPTAFTVVDFTGE